MKVFKGNFSYKKKSVTISAFLNPYVILLMWSFFLRHKKTLSLLIPVPVLVGIAVGVLQLRYERHQQELIRYELRMLDQILCSGLVNPQIREQYRIKLEAAKTRQQSEYIGKAILNEWHHFVKELKHFHPTKPEVRLLKQALLQPFGRLEELSLHDGGSVWEEGRSVIKEGYAAIQLFKEAAKPYADIPGCELE